MTTINDAEVGDIYVDSGGKLWRVTSVCREPTVAAEEVEGTLCPAKSWSHIHKVQHEALTSDQRWQGWRRIWRKTDV